MNKINGGGGGGGRGSRKEGEVVVAKAEMREGGWMELTKRVWRC